MKSTTAPAAPSLRRGIAAIRAEIPALRHCLYLNTGTLGASPEPVTAASLDAYRAWQEGGPGGPDGYGPMHDQTEPVRGRAAAFLNCAADELAFTGNATDGCNVVVEGLGLKPGDEVVSSTEEHPALAYPLLWLRDNRGVRLRLVPLPPDHDRLLEGMRAAITPRTRLVAMSHVSCQTGLRVPAEEITRLAHAAGAHAFFDGAQAVGQVRVDLRAIGCGYYATNGHKWLLAPVGTGLLYARAARVADLRPAYVGGGSAAAATWAEDGAIELHQTARRYEFGSRNWAGVVGMGRALDYMDEVGGIDAIEARGKALAWRAHQGLKAIPGVTVHSPEDDRLRTAIVSFSLRGHDATSLFETLWHRFRIATRPVAEYGATRLSCAFYLTEEEIDAAVAAVAQLAKEAG